MPSQLWGSLNKAINDPTLIDQEIETQITAHKDDPNAHLEAGQALTTHRAAEVIDHIAESVVNDKLATLARAYVAIVGSGNAGDFDTIQAAITFAISKGGGTIFIAPGEYYLSGAIELPTCVNITTADPETVIIHGGYTGGNYFKIINDSVNGQRFQDFTNITFFNDGGGVFHTTTADLSYAITQTYANCNFNGGGQYIYAQNINMTFSNCIFYISNALAISTQKITRFNQCSILRYSTATTCYFFGTNAGSYDVNAFYVDGCNFDCTGATTAEYFSNSTSCLVSIRNTRLINWACAVNNMIWHDLFNCYITCKSNQNLTISSDGNECTITANTIYMAGTGKIICTSTWVQFNGNLFTGGYSGLFIGINLYADGLVCAYLINEPSYAPQELASYETVLLSPNSTRTVTTTVPRAGSRRTFIVLTSGTTSYVITFGTGFKTTGTLTTGTVSGRRFVISFVSDGTYLIECSRTVAIA